MDGTLEGGVLVAVIVVGIIQLGLVVWALVDLIRRPETSGLPRWAWVIIILLLNILGPLLYFAVGRQRTTTIDDGGVREGEPASSPAESGGGTASAASGAAQGAMSPAPDGASRARRAVDSLYGPDDRADG